MGDGPSPLRILMVNDRSPVGGSGAEIHLSRLADALRGAGHEVRIFAGDVTHEGAAKVLDLWDPRARRMLREAAAELRADVVHFHNVTRELSGSVLGAVPEAACVLTIHDPRILGVPDGPAGAPIDAQPARAIKMAKARIERVLAVRHMDAVIALTGAMGDAARSAGFESVHAVPNLAPPGSEARSLPSSSTDVLFAGRLAAAKGCAALIEAFARIAPRHPDARLLFAGDGPERAQLEARATEVAGGRVLFLGMLSETQTRELMARVRLLALPSLGGDVAPNVVVEAAFAGRPVVISAIPGIHELVDESGGGIVVPPGDLSALARALDDLLTDGTRADAMGRAARDVALATRSPAVVAALTLDVYRAAIARRPKRRRPRASSGIDPIRQTWNGLGETDPLWAVLSLPEKRGGRWNLEEFLATGRAEIDRLMARIDELGIDLPRGRALDFGCGVGRLTQALAAHFDHVTGVDIAPSMIAEAIKVNRVGDRVGFVLNREEDLSSFPDASFDLVYSNITLQHMPPHFAKAYIAEFVRVVTPRGLIAFQVPAGPPPTLARRVKSLVPVAARERLQAFRVRMGRPPRMQMYCIPRSEVIATLARAGATVLHADPDHSAGPDWTSFRYFASRRVSADRSTAR